MSDAQQTLEPRIAEATKKIQAIFKEYDLGGAMIVVSPTQAARKTFLDPSWSAIRVRRTHLEFRSIDQEKINPTAHLTFVIKQACAEWGNDVGILFQALLEFAQGMQHLPAEVPEEIEEPEDAVKDFAEATKPPKGWLN